jgi:arylsulfatase A-like enzyme
MMDILPTLAKIGGGKTPAGRKIDGVDIWPVLSGEKNDKPPRDDFYYFRGLTLEAVRSGPWKLHLATAGAQQGKKKAAAKLQLYNLADDISESKDVAAEHSEIALRLKRLAKSMDGDLGQAGIGPGCRPLGRVPHPQPLIDDEGNVRPGAVGSVSRFP